MANEKRLSKDEIIKKSYANRNTIEYPGGWIENAMQEYADQEKKYYSEETNKKKALSTEEKKNLSAEEYALGIIGGPRLSNYREIKNAYLTGLEAQAEDNPVKEIKVGKLLDEMMKCDMKLYEQIMDTTGFAYYFNELIKLAMK